MLNSIISALKIQSALAPVDAANTAASTSGWIDVRGYEGQIGVLLHAGVLDDGSLTYTFHTATDGSATGIAAVTPVSGTPVVVTTDNDNPNIQKVVFEATQLKGFLRITATKAESGGALVAFSIIGLQKYPS